MNVICFKLVSLLSILFVLSSAPVVSSETAEQLNDVLQQLSLENIRQHTATLGSDFFRGRATGTRGEQLAAEYIRDELKKAGVEPGLRQNYFQHIPLHGSTPLPSSVLTLYLQDRELPFRLGDDYVLYNSGEQTFVPKPLPLVFVGYGIVAPEFDYNDYQSIDVQEKIVVFLAGEPASDDPDYFHGASPTIYSYAEAKERLAISRGARGSILIPNPQEMFNDWESRQRQFSFEDVTLAYSVTGHLSLMMNPLSAELLFEQAPYSFQQTLDMHNQRSIKSFDLNSKLSFRGQFNERDFLSQNVIGRISGTDHHLNDTYVLVTAHYDHLGIGTPVDGDSIYNGVVDNAIGVAAVLEMARVLQTFPPKRSVLFLFVTGEEKGVLGSTYYIDNPVVPHYKSVAHLNVDGLAIFDTFRDIIGFGSEYSTLGTSLERIAEQLGLYVGSLPQRFSRLESFARSDQIVFAKVGIPAILIMDGVDYEHMAPSMGGKQHLSWMQTYYHSPFDDLNQPLHWKATLQHCRVLCAFALEIANNPTPPAWLPGTSYATARLQSIAEKR